MGLIQLIFIGKLEIHTNEKFYNETVIRFKLLLVTVKKIVFRDAFKGSLKMG